MRFSEDDLQRFAEWSGDRNPLHVDPVFARSTPYGQPIAHGMLSVLHALGAALRPSDIPLTSLDIEFRGAVVPLVEYEVESTWSDGELTIAVRSSDTAVLNLRGTTDQGETGESDRDTSWTTRVATRVHEASADVRREPTVRTTEELEQGVEIVGTYRTSATAGAPYAGNLHGVGEVLALCSYIVGMELPGLRSLFTGVKIRFARSSGSDTQEPHQPETLLYRARTRRFDRHFRILDTEIDIATVEGQPVATGLVRSYVPFGSTPIDLDTVSAHLSPAAGRLDGVVALVCGGSRGLGADVCAALALAGSHVYVGARGAADLVSDLRRRLQQRGRDIEFVQGDAGDPAWCQQTVERIRSIHGRLDLLVLNACSAPSVLRIGPDAFARQDEYVRQNLRLVQVPLAACLSALDESRGTVAYVSSSFVDDTPPGFSHYVALKQAGEAVVRSAQRESPRTSVLIARPPRLQTSWNDTPTGAAGAIPTASAALHVVNRLAERWQSAHVEVLSEFPTFAPVAALAPVQPDPNSPRFPLRLCATFTTDPLQPGLRFWLGELGLQQDVAFAPYGQVLQTLLDPNSIFAGRGGINVLLVRMRDWLRELAPENAESIDFVRTHLQEMSLDLSRAMRAHRARAAAETLLLICPSYGANSSAESILLRQAETDLVTSLQGLPGLRVVHAADYHSQYGVDEDQASDPIREKLAHIPYRDTYCHTLATIIARNAHRRLTRPRKVVVVDCDNTLWRGVVGEVGPEGVEFDASHAALHDRLNQLTKSGLLVCLCSKNDEADVWRVFDTRQELTVRRESVVASVINWQPKSENLRALAARLNLGLDSFVFIDDNPVECAEVRARCPEVLTLQWPLVPHEAQRLLNHAWELDPVDATKEDERRTQMYHEEFRRQELRDDSLSFADFINNLALDVEIAPLIEADLRRASQLTLRTNQFNFTTRRRDEGELQGLMGRSDYEILTVRVRDRFGDYGLVGLLIAELRDAAVVTDTFLLSCRVLGRGVEHRMAAELGRLALKRNLSTVRMRVDTTQRNAPARKFLESIASAGSQDGNEKTLACEFAANTLAGLRFEPIAQPTYVPSEADGDTPSSEQGTARVARAGSTNHERRREAQIARACELADPIALATGIDGVTPAMSSMPAAIASGNVEADVYDAFASALRIPAARVKEVDRLEALGCDSMKIVDITVALLEKYPSLPSTLLFEHRSVSAIVEQITALSHRETGGLQVVPTDPREQPGLQARVTKGTAAATDIAVVGMHVRCAGANSPDELWDLLCGGHTAVRPVETNRQYFLTSLADARPHWAGLLDDVSRFDAEFFGISPREAELMDPQLRLFLEVAWAALEDAGCTGVEHDSHTGVFAGVMYGDYGYRANVAAKLAGNPYRSWEGFSLANRLSQILGFRGPSLAIDTACSSSGTALHLASQALNAGDCRVAIVGGVNLILDPDRFGSLGRLGILSPRGKCEPFGADADGTVLGEGAGVVVLRPLSDALRRADRIYGVIKGTGLSTGSGTVGFTAPNPHAQAEAIERAVRVAGIDPRTISYVETHGTGTVLGDPIEVRGLTLAYAKSDLHDSAFPVAQRCRIGSIKPNIGHLEAGAGILGLIKVLLQMERGMLLPSITSTRPNPHIPFSESPFDVQKTLDAWERHVVNVNGSSVVVPRRAGLSSFGVGGANAHVILEEAPALRGDERADVDRPAHLLTLSARSADALRRQASTLHDYLKGLPEASLADVCFTTNVRRKHFEHRLALAVTSREQLLAALDDIAHDREAAGVTQREAAAASRPKIAFLFTGQGSQYAGMGRSLYETQPVFRDALDRCAAIFDRLLGQPLLDLLFANEHSPEAALLNQTGFTQPALFAFEYALAELWRSWGITPDIVMGHSVGELAAICVAGGVSLDDGLKLIAARGRLMQALPPGGTMTSVMAAEGRVQEAIAGCTDRVAIAAINAPGQVVISGAGVAVAEITARLEADGIKTKALTVSHAFHSPLMRPMVAEYEAVVREITFRPPQIPFVSCVDGTLAAEQVTSPDYWVRNVTDPVRFTTGMQVLEGQGVSTYIEIGPQPVLLGMGRQCVEPNGEYAWLPSLRKDVDSWQTILTSVARLFVDGASIDWKGFDAPYARHPVSIPSYSFNRKQYWLRSDILKAVDDVAINRAHVAADDVAGEAGEAPAIQTHGGPEIYELAWRQQPLEPPQRQATASSWLIFADQSGLGVQLAESLVATGVHATLVFSGENLAKAWDGSLVLNPRNAQDFESILEGICAAGEPPSIAYLWGLDSTLPVRTNDVEGTGVSHAHVRSLVHVAQAMAKARLGVAGAGPRLWVITRSAVDTGSGSSPIAAAQAMLWGLGRTIAVEQPELWGGLVDVASDRDTPALTRELLACDRENQIALRDDLRFVARLERRPIPAGAPLALDPAGTYLVTGGLGALGLRVAERLVARGARHLVLTARRHRAGAAVDTALDALRQAGAEIVVATADVTRADDVDRVLRRIASGAAPLKGIIHAAGIDTSVPMRAMNSGDLDTVLGPKATGAWLLHDRTRDLSLDLFVCFSSMASMLGAQGRAHYAAANAFLDALAFERRRLGMKALSVNWGPWRGGGMASAEQLEQFERIGNYGLQPDAALDVLERLLSAGDAQTMVADVDWLRFREVYEAKRAQPVVSALRNEKPRHRPERPAAQPARNRGASAPSPWVSELIEVPADQREMRLMALLRAEVAATLGFERAEDVAVDRQFSALGMDSLMMAEFISRLGKRIGTSSTALVFEHPEVRLLAPRLLEALAPVLAMAHAGGSGDTRREASEPVVQDGEPSPTRGEVIHGYSSDDESEIFAFQAHAWPHRRPDLIAPRWRWMFVDSARRLGTEPRIWLARDGHRVVGHMGAIPVGLKIGCTERQTAWLVDTMVLESHRASALGSRLMVQAHEDVPFALSLGQTAEMRGILVRLGWKQVAPLQTAQLLIRPQNVFKGKIPTPVAWAAGLGVTVSVALREALQDRVRFEIRTIDRFSEEHNVLWKRAARDIGCGVVRDASYLNWKYVDQPGQEFVRLEMRDNDTLVGSAVLMFREPDRDYQYRRGFLVDLVAPLSDGALMRPLVRGVAAAAEERGADALVCMHVSSALTAALRGCGFLLREPTRFLLVSTGDIDGPAAQQLLSPDSWFVTQGDSDIDRPW